MLHYVKLLLLLATINFILCTEHLSYPEWQNKFNEYEKALREQMRPNSMADTILLIHHLDKAVESQPKDWNWKLRATNSTLPAPEYHGATEEDAAEILAILKKYKLNETNGTADVNPEKLKHLEAKIKDQSKLYKKTINKFERPVFRYQRRRQQRRKLRQQIAQKLFGKTGGTSTIQISVLQTLIIVTSTAYQIYI